MELYQFQVASHEGLRLLGHHNCFAMLGTGRLLV